MDNNASSNSTGNRTQLFALIFVVILLLLVFRAALAPLVTLLPAALVVQIASPVVGELAKHGVVQVSEITQLLLIILIIGAGTDYGLFLVFRVREELRAGSPPKVAVAKAMARVGESITFSAATVIAAVLCLLLASFGFYHGLALPLAIGIGLMLLAGLTLLPALLAIFGRAVFWPSNVRPGLRRIGVWGRVAGQVIRRPVVTITVGVVLFGGLAFAVLGYTAGGFAGGANRRPTPIPRSATPPSPRISPRPPPTRRTCWCGCRSPRGSTRAPPARSNGTCPASSHCSNP